MLNRGLTVLIVKRVLICYILLSIIDVVLVKQRWLALFGLSVGAVFGVLKFISYSWVFGRIASGAAAGIRKGAGAGLGILVFAFNQILLLPLLFVAYKFDMWFFTGLVAGILLVPFAIMLNCLTEAIGITHNNFE